MGDMFQQPVLAVDNPAVFEPMKAAIEAAFAPALVAGFLESVERAKLRVRDFEALREQGFLGEAVKSGYAAAGQQRPGPDSRAVSAQRGAGRAGAAREVSEGLRVLLTHFSQPENQQHQKKSGARNGEGEV